MAKRVLSLLLALVMALSLCVPAFAAEAPVDEADEVGAEAVEEVVDEAAAEPEAEPAEEPAEEPVDEPAEVAADEPAPIVNSGVKEESIAALQAAVDAAKETYLPGVQDGTYHGKNSSSGSLASYKSKAGCCGAFLVALENAEMLLAKYKDDKNESSLVTDAAVTAATKALENEGKLLTKTITWGDFTKATATSGHTNYDIGQNLWDKYDATGGEDLIEKIDDPTDPIHETYQPEFLESLKALATKYMEIADAAKEPYSHKALIDLQAEVKAMLPGSDAETAAKLADADDLADLQDAIDAAKAAVEAAGDDIVKGSENTEKGTYLYFDKEIKAAEALLTTKDVTLKAVLEAIEALDVDVETVPNTVYIHSVYWDAADNGKLIIDLRVKNTSNTNKDTHTYYLTYTVNGSEANETMVGDALGVFDLDDTTLAQMAKNGNKVELTQYKVNAQDVEQNIPDSANITVTLTSNVTVAPGAKPADHAQTVEYKVNQKGDEPAVKDHGYVGDLADAPDYKLGESSWGEDTLWVAFDKSIKSSVTSTKEEAENGKYRLVVTGPGTANAKFVAVGNGHTASNDWSIWAASFVDRTESRHTELTGKVLTMGTWTVVLQKGTPKADNESEFEWADIATTTIEVPAVTAYAGEEPDPTQPGDLGSGYPQLVAAIEVAKGYTDLYPKANGDDIDDNADAMEAAIEAAEAVVAAAATNVNSKENRKAIDAAIDDLEKQLANYTDEAADTTALEKAIAAANALREDDYTAASWLEWTRKSPALLKTANDLLAAGLGKSSENTTAIKDAATAITNAIKTILKDVEGDTSELEAAIEEAEAAVTAGEEAVADADKYTAESVNAVKEAITALEQTIADAKVLADANSPAKKDISDMIEALADAVKAVEDAVAALVEAVDADDLAAAIEAAEAAIADPSKYTDESVLAVQDAITAAKALGDDATADEIADAIEALDAAVKGLVPAEAEPELKEGWNLIEGEYYYCKDGKMVKSDWVKSKGLWYHMGADGTMDTGFIHIVDDWGDGWYYLEPSNAKGTEGRMRTGWQEINDATAGHWGWFETRSNGHQGMCTYTTNQGDYKDYKPVK